VVVVYTDDQVASRGNNFPWPVQQLEPLASNLDVVRRSVEQLAAKQEQMAQNMATLQAVEEDIRQKMSSPPSPSQPAASIPIPQQKKPATQGAVICCAVVVGASPAASRWTTLAHALMATCINPRAGPN